MRNKKEGKRWRNGQFFEAPKSMKMFLYVYITALGISKEDFTVFLNPCNPSRMVFGVHCNRVFYKFPGWSLLWTTTVVYD